MAGDHAGSTQARSDEQSRQPARWLALGLVVLAVAVAVNSLLGPLFLDVIDYPIGQSLLYQTMGLEAVSLVVVAPWCLVAALLVWRGKRAGPILALPPTGYVVYMFAQYVVGPGYGTYNPVVFVHLGVFVLSGALLLLAWGRVDGALLPATSERRDRRAAAALVILAAFTVSRYLGAFSGAMAGVPIPPDATGDPAMYWAIVLLDLGVVVPLTIATVVGLVRGAVWARGAVYGIAGWFTLVPISVLSMSLVMLSAGDPNAAIGDVVVLGGAALVFSAIAAWVYRPLIGRW